ncbi:LysM peptidoglycan-binding domain-containing protein [Peribacillus asahii]|uniref:LysM peptidoglycan-binding domain-containing protein n=1 Tax=Peribacillus asahii TaxID=228899 RepID=UPI002079667F|nr:LysM peptidoglycan-binding domain-containing protein [Peribacillus asahii]USK58985.1 LysM peptidoglycan-binding domain-containing protein [Peribacillus asahii]
MTEENQSYLRFSLEESVWFQKGQEVAELYSISLDPNVTIQEDEHYVYMRGTLDLSGEYKDSGEQVDGDVHTFLPRSVQTVERHPNGISEFIHRFPVDITIPSTRITSLDDIEVMIQTFDYTLPERNCLKLQADLIISGIYRETYVEPELEDYQVWDDDESPVATDERQELDEEIEDEVVEVELADIRQEEIAEVEESVEAEEFADERADSVENPALQIEEESPVSYTAAAPQLPDFQPTFRQEEQQEGELYEPFIVEAKRTPDVEEERVAPLFISKQPDIPVFDFSVPKFQEREEEQEIEPVLEKKVEEEQEVEPVLERKVEEEQKAEPVLERKVEEQKAEPVLERKVEEQKAEPVLERKVEEPKAEPVLERKVEEPKAEPVLERKVEEPKVEPVLERKVEEPKAEPVLERKVEEPKAEPVLERKVEEPKVEPVLERKVEEEPKAEPVLERKVEEPKAEPVLERKVEEPKVEPVLERKVEEEPKAEPVLERKVEEPKAEQVLEQEVKEELEKVNLLHLVNKREVPSVIVQQDKRESQQEEEKKVEKSEQKARTNESQPLSIMDFFSRKQEEEHVKVKVCIVQQGETIDDLAERYSVNPQTLLQSNELEPHQDIYEGQVLYIPRSASYKN